MKSGEELCKIIETEAETVIENLGRAYVDLIDGLIRLETKLTPDEMDRIFRGKNSLILKYAEEIIKKQTKEKLKPTKEEEEADISKFQVKLRKKSQR